MPQNPTPAAAGDTNLTTNLTPDIGSLEHLASMAPETRLNVAAVWAAHVESSANFTPADSFKGTLVHLQWAVTEIERLRARYDNLDKTLDEVLTERDAHHDALGRFALAVAPEEAIGEHSSGNNPWANAFELVTPAAEVDALRARVAELEGQANCPSQMRVSSGTSRCALLVRHGGDHRNSEKNHYWSDEYADAARVRPAEDEDSHEAKIAEYLSTPYTDDFPSQREAGAL